jgi:hypothetical protein
MASVLTGPTSVMAVAVGDEEDEAEAAAALLLCGQRLAERGTPPWLPRCGRCLRALPPSLFCEAN